MANKNLVIGVMIVIIAVLIVVFYSTTGSADNRLRVGYVPVSSSMLTFTTLDQRYLEEEGFQVETTSFQTSNQLAEAVANGQVDLGGTVASTPVFTISQKDPDAYKILATSILKKESPFTSIITKKNSGVDVDDLPSKTIALFPGSTSVILTDIAFERMFEQKADPDYVQMPPNLWLAALERGDVDAVLAYEPFGTMGEMRGISQTIYSGPYENLIMDSLPAGVVVVSKAYSDKNPQNMAKITSALQRSLEFIDTNDHEARLLSTKFMPIDEAVALGMNMTGWEVVGDLDEDRLQRYADLLYENGDLEMPLETGRLVFRP